MSTATPSTPQSNPAHWLQEMASSGALSWTHDNTNVGLLLAPLLEVHGWQGDIHALRDALPAHVNLVGLSDVLSVMGALGYRMQQETVQSQSIREEQLPALFVPTENESWCTAIMLREMSPYGLVWEDGRQRHRSALPQCLGTLYRFERIIISSDEDETNKTSWLTDLAERFRPHFWHIAALSLVMHVFTLAMPLFSMAVYDRVIAAHAPATLWLLTFGVLMALGAEAMVRFIRIRIAAWMGARLGILVTGAMFERLLFLPASVIEQASVSAQLARVRAFETVRDFVTGPMFLALLEIPFLLVLVLAIALLAGPVAFIAVGVIAAHTALLLMLKPSWQRMSREAAHGAARRQQLMMNMIENQQQIFASGMNGRILQRFKALSWQAAQAQHRFTLTASAIQHIAGLLTVIAGLATIGWCLGRIWEGAMTGGTMVATMIITWRVLFPLQVTSAILPHIEQIRGAMAQVNQLMNLTPESHAQRIVLAQHPLKGHITLQQLGLRYGRKSDPIFMGLSMDISPGQIIAIYGGNGSGKSSILRLLLGLYQPAAGSIRFDGVDHRQFDPRNLRRQIAYLPQQPELIPGTIAENLRLADPIAPEFKMRQALLWADAWEFIEQLPAGLDTRIGAEGTNISSGLAARLCLARLYLAQRPLILCDELPAQILNSATGERFRRHLEQQRGKQTVIFVTHRDDMLAMADQVVWLKPDARPVVTRADTPTYREALS